MAKETIIPETAPPADDEMLARQARSGDMDAFSRLVLRYQDRILNVCWRISGNLDDAHDLTQETFLKALRSLDTFQGRSRFYTWLFRIAANLAISHRRRQAKAVRLSLHGPDGQWSENHQAARLVSRVSRESDEAPVKLSARETQQRLIDGLAELDDDHRAVVVLRDVEGMDYRHIAETLEMPVGTVRSRLHRARLELRKKLKDLVS